MSEPANMREIAANLTCDTLRNMVIDLTGALNNKWLKSTPFEPKESVLKMRDFCVAYLDEQWPGWNDAAPGKKFVDVPKPVVERVSQSAPGQAQLL